MAQVLGVLTAAFLTLLIWRLGGLAGVYAALAAVIAFHLWHRRRYGHWLDDQGP